MRKVLLQMKKLQNSGMLLSVFTFLIAAAPLIDMSSRSTFTAWGQPDYPQE